MPPEADRWNRLRMRLCWASSVMAPALAALKIVESDKVPTMAIDTRGRVFVNPECSKKFNDLEVNFVLLHECLHLVLRHFDRRYGRDPRLWNIAADLVINDAIPSMLPSGSVQAPPWGLDRRVHTPDIPPNLTVEEVYKHLHDAAKELNANGEVGAGCGVTDGGDGGNAEDDAVSSDEWRNIARNIGSSAAANGSPLSPLLTIPNPRIAWTALLRDIAATAASTAGRDVTSWKRRNRRSPRQVCLPGHVTNMVRIAVVIDASGSVGDNELASAIAEAQSAVDAAGISALLVVHDHEVQSKAWITPGGGVAQVQKRVKGRGGTLFSIAYDAVEAEKAEFMTVVHFTDGYPNDTWPPAPTNCRRAICALTPGGSAAQVPSNWRTVEIELPEGKR